MRQLNARNLTLMALVACCFIQIGAQLFALSVVARTVVAAPPRSLAIFDGEYGYDSSAFWDTVPPITSVLLVIALITNWKTDRRKLLLLALLLLAGGAVMAGVVVEPVFHEMVAMGYRDEVDAALQARAARWYALDWGLWSIALASGIVLLLALIRPVGSAPQSAGTRNSNGA